MVDLFIAIGVSLYWVTNGIETHQISLGAPFMSFLNSCSRDLSDIKIEIPSIPKIPYFEEGSGWLLILNAFIAFVNGISGVINFLITIINVLIEVLEFLFIIIRNLMTFKDTLATS